MPTPAHPGTLDVTWLGQSGFVLRSPLANLLVDRFLSDRGKPLVQPTPLEALWRIDIVAATHEHWDHLDLPAVVSLLVIRPQVVVLVPSPIVEQGLEAGVAPDRVRGTQTDEDFVNGELHITLLSARHGVHVDDAYNFGIDLSDGKVRFLGYVFSEEGVVVYHAGDTVLYDEMAPRLETPGVQLALLPINSRDPERKALDIVGNLSPDEATSYVAKARIHVIVPMHYDMFAGNPGFSEQRVTSVAHIASGAIVLVFGHQRRLLYTGTAA